MKRVGEFLISLIASLVFAGVWYVFSIALFVPERTAFVFSCMIFIIAMLEFVRK
jgi:hypothetical protein